VHEVDIIRLEKTDVTETYGGKPVHYAVPVSTWDIPTGYLGQDRFAALGNQPMLMFYRKK
jgi:hypothetical protein